MGRSALHPTIDLEDDDIVHPLQKCLDTCNQFVAGSSPAAGAREKTTHQGGFFILAPSGESDSMSLSSGLEKVHQIFLEEISITYTACVTREIPAAGEITPHKSLI